MWGGPGVREVAWGDFGSYLDYVRDLTPYLPAFMSDAAGWAATGCEAVLGLTLLLGVATRLSAWASAGMLLVFALSMFFFVDPEAPFNASVFSACAAALVLALAPRGAYACTADRLLGADRVGQPGT
ncbi:DoxX family membrane protein [Yinghuangia sp. YIM S09857]|uniref:DoxX family membrane protein n=1 Tax=Yinghuangia sp. YIM S09857 TaxID=3436929 RepID=UPI003F5397FA